MKQHAEPGRPLISRPTRQDAAAAVGGIALAEEGGQFGLPPKSRPVAKPPSRRREYILKAASAKLRARGLSVSLQEIADELGLTYTALYRHFRDREDLIVQCLWRATDLLHETLLEVAARQATGLDRATAFLAEFKARSAEEQTPLGALALALSPEAQASLDQHIDPSRELLACVIDEGIADGSVGACDSLVTAAWILHMLYWWPHEIEWRRPPDVVAESIVNLVRRALAAPARSDPVQRL